MENGLGDLTEFRTEAVSDRWWKSIETMTAVGGIWEGWVAKSQAQPEPVILGLDVSL